MNLKSEKNYRAIRCCLKAGNKMNREPYERQTGRGVKTFYKMIEE